MVPQKKKGEFVIMKKKIKKYNHLSLEERKQLEEMLSLPNITLKQIASSLGRSEKCIRYEILTNRHLKANHSYRNLCGRQNDCHRHRLCNHCVNGVCKHCRHMKCNELCEDFIEEPQCKHCSRFPYVCSGCKHLAKCKMPHYFYYSSLAQDKSINRKRISKQGSRKSPLEMKLIATKLKEGLKRGLSIKVIVNKEKLPCSVSSVYRYIDNHQLEGLINLDLKRKVRYTPRKPKPTLVRIDYDYTRNRSYKDFSKRIASLNSEINIWEMDTIMGVRTDNKCVLSLLHRRSNLQLYFLLPYKNSIEVSKVFDYIKEYLGIELFKKSFPIILTDNGSEFKDPLTIEIDNRTGEKVCEVYYCEPRRSDEKGKCEKNHEHFREIYPKGNSLQKLSRKDINYISLMVNNYPREIFSYNSPYEVASLTLNKKVLDLNKLNSLPHDKLRLTPLAK